MNEFDYCERLDAGFWAEPVNAVSNVFFIVFAYLAYRYLRRSSLEPESQFSPVLLIMTLVAIGIGSFLWHTYANRWAELADVIPITLFMHLYLYFFARNIIRLGSVFSLFFVLSFVGVNYLFSAFIDAKLLNGSIAYVPALLYLLAMTGFMGKSPYLKDFAVSILIFIVSMLFRTIDFLVCDLITAGTHSLWHTLNAVFLYRLIILLVDVKQQKCRLRA